MSRPLRLTSPYRRNAIRLGIVAGSERGRAVGRALATLMTDERLPAPTDTRALRPPTGEAFVRRVHGRNLWVWYTLRGEEVFAVALTADPPVPVDE